MMPILHSGKFSQDLVVQNQSRTDFQALDEKVKSMMEKGQKMIPDGGKQYRDGTPKQSDLIFVKTFTRPEFGAKNFTH